MARAEALRRRVLLVLLVGVANTVRLVRALCGVKDALRLLLLDDFFLDLGVKDLDRLLLPPEEEEGDFSFLEDDDDDDNLVLLPLGVADPAASASSASSCAVSSKALAIASCADLALTFLIFFVLGDVDVVATVADVATVTVDSSCWAAAVVLALPLDFL